MVEVSGGMVVEVEVSGGVGEEGDEGMVEGGMEGASSWFCTLLVEINVWVVWVCGV